MPTKNLKHSLWDSDYYRLTGLPRDQEKNKLSPKSTFKSSSIKMAGAIVLWVTGLGIITWLVMITVF